MAIDRAKPLYAYYGDDFTGSTDVLEALALHGLPGVLFTHPPEERELAAFPECRAIGIAGESRSRDPEWMTNQLPTIFAQMKALGAPVNHYKVCSTFDSAPHIGSIGRAMELGRSAFEADFVPVVVGAPLLGRSVAFGNLFATMDGAMLRIDRHPSMSLHPVTPMTEADLRIHLAKQTALRMGLIDLTAFQSDSVEVRILDEVNAGAEAVIFDGIDEAMLDETARRVWEHAALHPIFAVGSSGLTYGLLRHWQQVGLIGEFSHSQRPSGTDRLLVLSGSCSPGTARQIRRAEGDGFLVLHLEGQEPWGAQTRKAMEALSRGQSVVLYTALGAQQEDQMHGAQFSVALGQRLRELLLLSGVGRVLIAGGDTSSHAVQQLGLDALTFVARLVPGAPLCRGHAPGSPLDGLELVLKGGQIGPENFFAQVRDGG